MAYQSLLSINGLYYCSTDSIIQITISIHISERPCLLLSLTLQFQDVPKGAKILMASPLSHFFAGPAYIQTGKLFLGRSSQYSTSKTYLQILKIVIFHISETSSNEERSGESKMRPHPKNGDLYQKLKNVPYSFSKAL